jgi:hypothetical protein
MIRERLGAGKAAKKRLGRHVHGCVPYGALLDAIATSSTAGPELTLMSRGLLGSSRVAFCQKSDEGTTSSECRTVRRDELLGRSR